MPSHLDATGRIPIPHNLTEARASLLFAEGEVVNIQRQLEDPLRLARLGEDRYDRWRRGAKVALGKWCIEVHQLKEWIAEHQEPDPTVTMVLEYFVEPTAAELAAEDFWRE